MLYKVFIDDSGQKDYKEPYSRDFTQNPPSFSDYPDFWRNNYFVLCGVRIKQEDISEINDEINALKESCFGTRKVEIKSVWLRNPEKRQKHYLAPFGIDAEKLNKFGESFTDIISNHKKEMKLIAAVFDKRCYGDAKRQTVDGSPLLKSTQILFERIHYAGNYNIVIFDQMESSLAVSKGQHKEILGVFEKNSGIENPYVEKYKNITDIKFSQSCYENFLQVADVCAYNIYQQFVKYGREWSAESSATLNTYPYFERIRCNFMCNPTDDSVRGIGLTCIPDWKKVKWDLHGGCGCK